MYVIHFYVWVMRLHPTRRPVSVLWIHLSAHPWLFLADWMSQSHLQAEEGAEPHRQPPSMTAKIASKPADLLPVLSTLD